MYFITCVCIHLYTCEKRSGLPWWLSSKESACQCWRHGLDPRVGKIPWRRKWQPTPVFLPGKSHGQRNLVGFSPWGRKRTEHDLAIEQGCTPNALHASQIQPVGCCSAITVPIIHYCLWNE